VNEKGRVPKGIPYCKGFEVSLLVSAPAHLSPGKMAQYLKGKSSYRLQRSISMESYPKVESVKALSLSSENINRRAP
jgi:hypothetical protein